MYARARCVTCHRTTIDILKAVLVGMVNDLGHAYRRRSCNRLITGDKRYHEAAEWYSVNLRFPGVTIT